MQLMLSDEDARTLGNVIREHLPDMRREAAATELAARELKSELKKRIEVCERVVAELDRASGSPTGK